MCLLGTFAEHTVVNTASAVKIDSDIPLERACLLGCGVTTGWGSSVYAGQVGPGDYVAVVGAGGLGMNAIQGARLAGAEKIFAIDRSRSSVTPPSASERRTPPRPSSRRQSSSVRPPTAACATR